MKYCFVFFATCLLAGCSGLQTLDALAPHDGYRAQTDIAYGENPRQNLDIYIPDHARPTSDVIVFFYGGRWESGDKADYRFVGQAFASMGYVVVIADYRLYPQVYFPVFVQDGAHAVAWTHAHIASYGGNPDRIFLAGHSAGAYIAAMLAVNSPYLHEAGVKRTWIKGMIGLAGPYDFLPFTDADVKDIFSRAPDALTQPIHYVSPGLPPFLLLTGDEDTSVYPKNTHHLAQRLREAGDVVTERVYPGVAHIGILLSLAGGFRSKAPSLADIDRFINEIDGIKTLP